MSLRIIIKKLRGFTRTCNGSVLVESAIVLPTFFLLMFGTIEFGMIMYARALVDSAVIGSTQFLMTGNNPNAGTQSMQDYIKGYVTQTMSGLGNSASVVVTACPYESVNFSTGQLTAITGPCQNGTVNDGTGQQIIRYTASYTWKVLDPLLVPILGSSVPITSTTVFETQKFN